MAGIDNLDLLQSQQKEQPTHVHTSPGKATHVQTDVYVSGGGKCTHRHQILLDDESENILQELQSVHGSFNSGIRNALKFYKENHYGRHD